MRFVGPQKHLFYNIQDDLIEQVFIQSKLEPYLFMKSNMVCIVYVDDTILDGPYK